MIAIVYGAIAYMMGSTVAFILYLQDEDLVDTLLAGCIAAVTWPVFAFCWLLWRREK